MLYENYVENANETLFVFNMDNGKALRLKGDIHVIYTDVVSGGDIIKMIVRLSGGPNARIEVSMIIFKNNNRSFPIRGVEENIPGVCYMTGPKGWMDKQVICQ